MSGHKYTAQEARNKLYEIIRRDTSFEQKAQGALELGVEYLGADNGHLARIDQDTDHWEAIVSTDPYDGQFPPGLELDLDTTYCRRTLESDGQIALNDAPNQGWADDPAFRAHGLYCYHGTTLLFEDEPYGTICFVSEDPRREAFTDGETMFTELVARLLERELERERHETELARQVNLTTVLNRVLRHNIRNDMAVIRGYTQIMADLLSDEPYGEIALRNIDQLIQLGEKARELERVIVGDTERTATDVGSLVEYAVENVRKAHPEATITVDCEERITVAALDSFEQALTELVENAAKHSDNQPTVTVTVEDLPNGIEIQVTDDGPGLSTQERAVLREGAETPLVHGSGLGLWLVHWIVESHEGSIDTTVTDTGTTMRVTIPRLPELGTEKRVTELTRSRDQYRAAFEEATDTMVLTNDTGLITNANSAATTVFGLDKQRLLGRSIRDFLPDEFDFESEWEQFQRETKRHDTVSIEGADGVDRIVEYTGTANVVPRQNLFIGRDVTAKARQETELRMKTAAMDNAPIGITITDPTRDDTPIVYVNARFCEMSGYNSEEILGRDYQFMYGPESDPETVAKIREGIDNNDEVSVTVRNYRKDGSLFWNKLDIAPVSDHEGEHARCVGFHQDISEYM